LLEDYKDIKDMIEAEKAPKSEIINYRKYREKRIKPKTLRSQKRTYREIEKYFNKK
jgi:hypothetical protein